jgi:hypothetical protein
MKMRPSSFSKRLRFRFAANGSRSLSGRPVRPRVAHLVVGDVHLVVRDVHLVVGDVHLVVRDVHLVVRDVHLVVRDDQSVSHGATAGIVQRAAKDVRNVSRGVTAGIDLLVEIARIVVKDARIVVTVRADLSVRLGASAARARRATAHAAQDHA